MFSHLKILDQLVDAIYFGRPGRCGECKGGRLIPTDSGYKCIGNLTEWTRCMFTTQSPIRSKFGLGPEFSDDNLLLVDWAVYLTVMKKSDSLLWNAFRRTVYFFQQLKIIRNGRNNCFLEFRLVKCCPFETSALSHWCKIIAFTYLKQAKYGQSRRRLYGSKYRRTGLILIIEKNVL